MAETTEARARGVSGSAVKSVSGSRGLVAM